MDQNVIDKLKNAVTSKLSGQSDLRRNVIKNIEKGFFWYCCDKNKIQVSSKKIFLFSHI